MNRRERFLTAVRNHQPDRVPMFDFLFQRPLYQALIGRQPDGYNARDAIECALALNHDGVWLPFGGFNGFQPKYIAEDTYIDEWGTTFRTNDSAWPIDAPIDYPIKSRADLKAYTPPDPTLPGRTGELDAARSLETDHLAITGGVTGPFTTCWMLMGYERMALNLYDDPGILTEIFNISNEYNKEAARLSVEAGAEAMWISDDLGDSSRGFMRLNHFREYYLAFLDELVDYVDHLGVPVLLHCCGNFRDYITDLAQTKISSVHPLQRTAGWDLRWFKETWGHRFAIIGNIDSSRTLPFGTPEEVILETREAIDIAAPGGGYVLASDHSLHDGISVKNISALFKTGSEYGGTFYHSRTPMTD
jgi:uroporphyrinogen decarboxylase